jgi:hypothetical protein
MEASSQSGPDDAIFLIGWVKMPGASREIVGSVSLPSRPTTLGEARRGLHMVASDERTRQWLRTWAMIDGDERSVLLRLPDGWFELCHATIARVPGAEEHYVVRFDRRCPDPGPVE